MINNNKSKSKNLNSLRKQLQSLNSKLNNSKINNTKNKGKKKNNTRKVIKQTSRAHHCLTVLTKALANPFLPTIANEVCNPMAPTSTFDQTRYTHFQIDKSFVLWTTPNLASDIPQLYYLNRDASFYRQDDDEPFDGFPDFEEIYLVNGITAGVPAAHYRQVTAVFETKGSTPVTYYSLDVVSVTLPLPFDATDLGQTYNLAGTNGVIQGYMNAFGIKYRDTTPQMYKGGSMVCAQINRQSGFWSGQSTIDTGCQRFYVPRGDRVYGEQVFTYPVTQNTTGIAGAFPDPLRRTMPSKLIGAQSNQWYPAPKMKFIRQNDDQYGKTTVEIIIHNSYTGSRANAAGSPPVQAASEAAELFKCSVAANSVPSTSSAWNYLKQLYTKNSELFDSALRQLATSALRSINKPNNYKRIL